MIFTGKDLSDLFVLPDFDKLISKLTIARLK